MANVRPADSAAGKQRPLTCLSYRSFPIQHGQTLRFCEEQRCCVKTAVVLMSIAEAGTVQLGKLPAVRQRTLQ